MADPTLQTFCCIHTNSTRPGPDDIVEFQSGPYNVICILFSVFGILGATYQILPRVQNTAGIARRQSNSYIRSRHIIVLLATADLFAALGVLLRSALWFMSEWIGGISPTAFSFATVFCVLSSAWIQYFYTATSMWTFFYAYDVLKVVNEERGTPKLYHIVAWGLPAIFGSIGLSLLYFPDLNCHSMKSNAYKRILPNYMLTFLPILFVMIMNPFIYWKASQKAEKLLVSVAGRFTANERKHLKTLKIKFLCIIFVFYLCWLPNIINAFMLWTLWSNVPKGFLLFIWYLMAILNPLQALFNSLVYRKWGQNKFRVAFPGPRNFKRDTSEGFHLLDSHSGNRNGMMSEDSSKNGSFNGYGSL